MSLQFIIIGKDPGSKLDEALKYGHVLLTELDFRLLMDGIKEPKPNQNKTQEK